jgi:hypothetical protein
MDGWMEGRREGGREFGNRTVGGLSEIPSNWNKKTSTAPFRQYNETSHSQCSHIEGDDAGILRHNQSKGMDLNSEILNGNFSLIGINKPQSNLFLILLPHAILHVNAITKTQK